VDGVLQDAKRSAPFFREFRRIITEKYPNPEPFSIRAESFSDFPSSAGLASSSSGFAALAVACSRAAGLELSPEELSSLARIGSASAARSLFGGFTRLDARASFARQVFDENWWPEFRIIVIEVEKGPKAISSRQAMESTRISSPYYSSWVKDSGILMEKAVRALENKDLKTLGPLIRMSYLRMFGSMLAADPPVVYWKPESLSLIRMCEESRAGGIPVWETMDAGPQVKLFCTENETRSICSRLDKEFPALSYRICSPGKAPGKLTGGTFRQPDPGYRNPGDPET
jgi:diphosphomevalonate decarboxylase